jgi:hypothetical protein
MRLTPGGILREIRGGYFQELELTKTPIRRLIPRWNLRMIGRSATVATAFICLVWAMNLPASANAIWRQPLPVACPVSDVWSELQVPSGTEPGPDGTVSGIWSVAVREVEPPEVYLAGHQGAFKSQGCDAAWETIFDESKRPPGRVSRGARVVSVGGHRQVYLGSEGADAILVSSDDGSTWATGVSLSNGPRTQQPARSFNISADASSDTVAYARIHPGTMHGHEGFARTADGGLNWTILGRKPGALLLADPRGTDVVYTIGARCTWCRSNDGGIIFEEISSAATWAASPTAIGAQRSGARIWVALQDGSFWLTHDGGLTWMSMPSPPDSKPIRSVAAE